MNVLDVNSINLRNVYGTALGNTTGQTGSAQNQTAMPQSIPSPNGGGAVDAHPAITESLRIGGQANPVIGAIVFLALLIGLGFASKKFGSVDDFKSIRVSPFNVLIISMAAIIGMPIWKWLFTRFPVPAVSTWVASA